MRLSICEMLCGCDTNRRTLDWFRDWGISPSTGFDDDGPYLEFGMPGRWCGCMRRDFLSELRSRAELAARCDDCGEASEDLFVGPCEACDVEAVLCADCMDEDGPPYCPVCD